MNAMIEQQPTMAMLGKDWSPPTPRMGCVPLPSNPFLRDTKLLHSPPDYQSFSSCICLDPYLATISMDISVDPHPKGCLAEPNLMYYATIPPVKTITIRSHDFRWKIDAHATVCAYVTILDVLKSLHTAVYSLVTSEEARALAGLGIPVIDNRNQRLCNPRSRSDAEHVGLCRIDSLNGKRVARFKDLRVHAGELILSVEFSYF